MAFKQREERFDMRDFIQDELDKYDLGRLVAVVGPEWTNSSSGDWADAYYKLVIKYRPPGNEHREDVQFYDKRLEVNIGGSAKGGYWNRRNIRLAIKYRGQHIQSERRVEQVWASSQRELTTGKGAIEL